jgi:cytochrome b561
MRMTEPGRYTRVAMLLHWLVAVLIIANVALIWTVNLLPDAAVRPAIDTHKSIGITVLGLAIMRLLWRVGHKPPPLPTYPKWERAAAHVAHLALYVLIFAMPLSGWLHDSAWNGAATHPMYWFGLFEWPRLPFFNALHPARRDVVHDQWGAIHAWCSYILYALVAAHIAGALKHQWLDRHPELQRMLPGGRAQPGPAE